jgi:hypothetical protein
MVQMRGQVDFGSRCHRLLVASHAEEVAGEKGFSGVRIMAVQATDSGQMHATGEKGGKFVVLIPHLTVRIKDIGFIGDGE